MAPPVTPADVAAIVSLYGFGGQWQERLLTAAAREGKVSVAAIEQTLAGSDELLTSDALAEVGAHIGHGSDPRVDSFESARDRAIARDADSDASGTVSAAEWRAFVAGAQRPGGSRTWVPDQAVAVLEALVAARTGEAHPLEVAARDGSTLLAKRYELALEDDAKRVPDLVAYQLTAADILLTPVAVHRTNDFRADPAYVNSPSASDYTRSGFDRGHQRPAEDSADQAAMEESFLMTNMAPQTPKLNEQSWRLLEQSVSELVRATGGSATVITGGLFLDAQGKPLPPGAVQWIGSDGKKTVAVPTHFFKVVLLKPADGPIIPLAYVVPNQKDLPMNNAAMAVLLRGCRTSIDRVEELSGMNLYPALGEAGTQGALEAAAGAEVSFAHPELYKAAALLWPQAHVTGQAAGATAARDRRFPAFIPSLWDRTR